MQLAWAGPALTESLAGRRPCDCCALHAWVVGAESRPASQHQPPTRFGKDLSGRTEEDNLVQLGAGRCLLGIPRLIAVTQVCSFRRNLAVATKSSLHLGSMAYRGALACGLGGHDAGLDWAGPDVDHATLNRGHLWWRCQHSWLPGHMVIRIKLPPCWLVGWEGGGKGRKTVVLRTALICMFLLSERPGDRSGGGSICYSASRVPRIFPSPSLLFFLVAPGRAWALIGFV